ncbi:DUF3943 domain-containing protein [Treponema sp. OttesenSCG-928-L16]|nr:DUF3943 domain-containing protein [Treponema sp. OttesenSCG-928-L16]
MDPSSGSGRVLTCLLVLILCVFCVSPCFSQELEAGREAAALDGSSQEKNYVGAIGNTLFSNVFLWAVNRFIGRTEYSVVSPKTWKHNLTHPWQWDQSTFLTNQVGHPYQGSTYHAAGRANGFNFYQSIVFDALGSATWELFAERARPALNDFIVTVAGGAASGEILHRLYLEAYASGSPFAPVLSPMHVFNNLVTRRKPETGGGNIMYSAVSAGGGAVFARYYGGPDDGLYDDWNTPSLNIRYDLSYGNPYVKDSNIPYQHFDISLGGGGGIPWYDAHFLSDGYLFSRVISDSQNSGTVLGLSLNYDFFIGSNSDFSSNAFNASLKHRRRTDNGIFEIKVHAGWLGIGVANFEVFAGSGTSLKEGEYRNYGTGGNAKLFLSLSHPARGDFAVSSVWYFMGIIPNTVDYSEGLVLYSFQDISYAYPFGERFSAGLGYSFYWKQGWYDNVPDLTKLTHSIRLYAKYTFKHPGSANSLYSY